MQDRSVHTRRFRILALVLSLAFLAAACGSDSGGGDDGDSAASDGGTTESTDPPEGTPVKGGEITFGLESNVSTLDAGAAAQPADKVITLGVYDPLMSYVDGELVPYLAETMEASEDLATYTMTLRSGVTFHDGTPLNADAVVQHFNRMKDPATGCPCQSTAANIASMDTPDGPEGLTVVFHLAEPSVAFPNDLAGSLGYIPSPTAVAAAGANFKNQPVGTGPFQLTQYRPGEGVVLEAYPDYWKTDENGIQLPYLDKITFVPIPDGGQRLAALEAGNVDIFHTAVSGDIAQAEEEGFAAQKISGSSSTILLMNNSKPPFDDVRARQAVAYAMNKDVFNERVYDGVREPSYSGFATDSPYYVPDVGTPKYDPDKARELVEELGGLEFSIVCIPTPEADQLLQLMKQMGEAVGMEITLESQEQGAYVERMFSRNGDYEAACFRSTHFVEPDAMRPGLVTDGGSNLSFYSNERVDELFELGRQTADIEERKEIYAEIQEITGEEVPLITTLYDLFGNVYDQAIVGPPPPGELNSLGAIKPGYLYAVGG